MTRPLLAITTGEPAGIGPEIALLGAFHSKSFARCILIGDFNQLREYAKVILPRVTIKAIDINNIPLRFSKDTLFVVDSPLKAKVTPGKLNVKNAQSVLSFLDIAIRAALKNQIDGIVTAPIQKSVINDANIAFTGHTEYLAKKTKTKRVVMMLAGETQNKKQLRVALATTHLPLQKVSRSISISSLQETISIINNDLKTRFNIKKPSILVAGLNPHAGENGYLGQEELTILKPVIQSMRKRKINVTGPYPADTIFQPHFLQNADCILSMFHDQGLPVLKYATFGQGVNITLGLPIIRTSVDHGTALDIAKKGFGIANYQSMVVAIKTAAHMAINRKNNTSMNKRLK